MRSAISAVLATFLGASAAAAAPATQPTTAVGSRVLLVLPFIPPPQGGYAWIGKSIQQDLTADLMQGTHLQVIAPASQMPATDAHEALEAARALGAGFVLYGQSQVSGSNLRVTGQVLDVAMGHPLAGLKATAPTDDLFPLEDTLASQAALSLSRAVGAEAATTPPAAPQEAYVPQEAPNEIYPPPQPPPPAYYSYQEPPSYSYDNYDYYYPYPDYYANPYWGWGPWWGPDVLIIDRFHHHGPDFDDFGTRPGQVPHLRPGVGPGPGVVHHGPVGHAFGHYGIGGPNVMGHGFGGARPGFGSGGSGGGHGFGGGGGGAGGHR